MKLYIKTVNFENILDPFLPPAYMSILYEPVERKKKK